MKGPALLTWVEKSSVMEEILVAAPSESFVAPSPSVSVKPAIATLVKVFCISAAFIPMYGTLVG